MEQNNTTQKLLSIITQDSKIIESLNDYALNLEELKPLLSTTTENNITQIDYSLSTTSTLQNNISEINNSNLISLISHIENDKNVELLSTTLNVNDKKIEFYDLSNNLSLDTLPTTTNNL